MTERPPLNRFSDRGLLEEILEGVDTLITTSQEGNIRMADIEASVDRLQTEVEGVKTRLGGVIEPLQQAIRDYQAAAEAAAAADAAEDADYEAKIAARDQALADLNAVVEDQASQIDQASDDLSKLAVDDAPPAAKGKKA